MIRTSVHIGPRGGVRAPPPWFAVLGATSVQWCATVHFHFLFDRQAVALTLGEPFTCTIFASFSLLQPILEFSLQNGRKAFKSSSTVSSFIAFNFIVAPVVILGASLALGALLAYFEGWTFVHGFYFVAQAMAGVGPFWVPDPASLTLFTEVCEILIAITAITIAACVIGFSALLSLSSNLPDKLGVIDSAGLGALAIFVTVPLFAAIFAAVVGYPLSIVEGWTYRQVGAGDLQYPAVCAYFLLL